MSMSSMTIVFGRIWYQNFTFSNLISGPAGAREGAGRNISPACGEMSGRLSWSWNTRLALPAARTRVVRQLLRAVYELVTELKYSWNVMRDPMVRRGFGRSIVIPPPSQRMRTAVPSSNRLVSATVSAPPKASLIPAFSAARACSSYRSNSTSSVDTARTVLMFPNASFAELEASPSIAEISRFSDWLHRAYLLIRKVMGITTAKDTIARRQDTQKHITRPPQITTRFCAASDSTVLHGAVRLAQSYDSLESKSPVLTPSKYAMSCESMFLSKPVRTLYARRLPTREKHTPLNALNSDTPADEIRSISAVRLNLSLSTAMAASIAAP
mmetsp:Transcript_8537/g.34957  ORF Transcript_8537/g.34957 Transcript_8537/m.34957 type:complete len:327 (-) Transcript_8537:1162-2142(-)